MKKTKIILAALTAAAMTLGGGVLAACNNDKEPEPAPEHEHTYAATWSSDATQHWHAATCEHTNEKKDVANHVDADEDGKCDVCEHDITPVNPPHTHNYSEWGKDDDQHWKYCPDDNEIDESTRANHDFTNGDCVCGQKAPEGNEGEGNEGEGNEGNEGGDENLTKITDWATVLDSVHGEVGNSMWHHIFLDDTVAQEYDFDSYTATVKLDGVAGEIIESQPFEANAMAAHAYHMQIHITGTRYQTAVFTISFKKDGETVAVGTYTREGDKDIALSQTVVYLTLAKDQTVTETLTVEKKGKVDGDIEWSIDDNSVATIVESDDGLSVTVTAVAKGTATVTAKVGDIIKTCTVNVLAEDEEIEAVDISNTIKHNDDFVDAAGKNVVQVRCELQGSDYALLVQQIDPSKTTVTVTMDGEESTTALLRKEWQAPGVYNLWLQIEVESDWEHDYIFTLSFKNTNGDEVANATYERIAPASITLSASTLKLELKDGETVTETLTATLKKISGNVECNSSDTNVATAVAVDNGDGTVTITVTAVAAGTANITVTADGLTKTCRVTVVEEGDDNNNPTTDLPDKQLTFNAPLKDYYGGTGNANYHDFIDLTEIKDNFEYSLNNIQVTATLNGVEIAIELLPNGSLGGDNNMHFHVKIGDGTTTLDEIKSGLYITMIFIGTDGQPCAYAIIEN